MMLKIVMAVVVGTAVVGGCAGPSAVVAQGQPAVAAPTTVAVPVSPVDAFIADVMDEPGLTWGANREQKKVFAESVCAMAPMSTREDLVNEMLSGTWSQRHTAELVLDKAKLHLCPDVAWGTVSAADSVVDNGEPHYSMPSDGVYQVTSQAGPGVRVHPGQYHSEGGVGSSMGCYWAKIDPKTRDTLPGQIGYIKGPDTVFLNEGDWFKTQNCLAWSVVR